MAGILDPQAPHHDLVPLVIRRSKFSQAEETELKRAERCGFGRLQLLGLSLEKPIVALAGSVALVTIQALP